MHSFLQIINSTIVLIAIICSTVFAHPRHTDPILSELNDYLPAIQFLKGTDNNPQAISILNQWLSVLGATWDLMDIVDNKGLNSNSPEITYKLEKTNRIVKGI